MTPITLPGDSPEGYLAAAPGTQILDQNGGTWTKVSGTSSTGWHSGNDFDQKYLGSKTEDPVTDNTGDPLIEGALYWNSTSNVLKFYDLENTIWADPTIDGQLSADAAAASAAVANAATATKADRDMLNVDNNSIGTALLSAQVMALLNAINTSSGYIREGQFDASGGIYPVDATGDMSSYTASRSAWYTTVAGVVGGRSHAVGDWVIWNGGVADAIGSWDKDESPTLNIPDSTITKAMLSAVVKNLMLEEEPYANFHKLWEVNGKALGGIKTSGEWFIPHAEIAGASETTDSSFANVVLAYRIEDKVVFYIRDNGQVFIPQLVLNLNINEDFKFVERLALANSNYPDAVLKTGVTPFTITGKFPVEPLFVVSFQDDDAIDNPTDSGHGKSGGFFSRARPVLKQFGMTASEGVIMRTQWDDTLSSQASYIQSRAVQNMEGWELTNHSRNHIVPSSSGYDPYEEWVRSVDVAKSGGMHFKNAVYPGGHSSHEMREVVRIRHRCGQGINDFGMQSSYFNRSPLISYNLVRYVLDASGGFGSNQVAPHAERQLASWKSMIDQGIALKNAGQRVWLILESHWYKGEWTNWNTAGALADTYAGGALPSDPSTWGAGEADYDSDWVIQTLKDGSGNIVTPTGELTKADCAVPDGWRPQNDCRLHDLYELCAYMQAASDDVTVVNTDRAMDLMANIADVGDFTNGGLGRGDPEAVLNYPHYVVGADGRSSFNPSL